MMNWVNVWVPGIIDFCIACFLVFRRKDLCEAKHDVVCLKFCSNLTIWGGGGKSSLPIWWLQIWGKSSLPISGGGVNHHCQFGCNWYLMIWGQIGSDDLPPPKSAGTTYPKSAVTKSAVTIYPPKLAGTTYPKSAVTKLAVTIYPPPSKLAGTTYPKSAVTKSAVTIYPPPPQNVLADLMC